MKKNITLLMALTLLVLVLFAGCGKNEITIVHFNDTHSHFKPFLKGLVKKGGAARRWTYVQSLKRKHKDLLLLHAGDILTGTAYSYIFHGEMSIDLMNRMGFHMMTVGNHEFDYGLEVLSNLEAQAEFPFISANIIDRATGELRFTPYITMEYKGIKIVIIGLTTSDWGVINQSMKPYITLLNEYSVMSNLIYGKRLAETNDLVIALAHMGHQEEVLLAEAIPELDLIIGGHTHTAVFIPKKINNTYVMQAGKYGQYVGEIRFKVKDGNIVDFDNQLTEMYTNIKPDPEISNWVAAKEKEFEKILEKKVGEAKIQLEHSGLRDYQMPIGNFTADVLQSYSDADFTVVNAGSIRNLLPQGDITLKTLFEFSPYDNSLVVAKLKGKDLKEIIARGIERKGWGAFLYYSEGIKVRVKRDDSFTATFKGAPIQDDRVYKVAVSDFVFVGGDGYTMFKNSLSSLDTGLNIRDLIIDYVKENKIIDYTHVSMDRRVIFEGED